MSSHYNLISNKHGDGSYENDLPARSNLSDFNKSSLEPEADEEEDDDADFNPFLKGSPSVEASSSLSLEIEGLDANVVDSGGENTLHGGTRSSKLVHDKKWDSTGNVGQDGRIVMQNKVALEEACEKSKKRKSLLMAGPQDETREVRDNGSSSGTDVAIYVLETGIHNTSLCKPITGFDDNDDAICKRTRARYSLASFTLDELETFLQETDDDDLQNVNEEEEYRKFLAAVLQGGDGDERTTQEIGNDDDEDNDADFEIEIEEALESDLDDCLLISNWKEENERAGRRPETRQKRRQRASIQSKKHRSEKAKRPLRPLLPSAPIAPGPNIDGRHLMPASHFLSSPQECLMNGFMPHQVGQLYCLLHEHVQLLIQVYSLCVLEPSRQHIASQVQGLLSEMLCQLEKVLAWRNIPYPSFCFCPPYIHPSAVDEDCRYLPPEDTAWSSQTIDDLRGLSSINSKSEGCVNLLLSDERYGHVRSVPADSSQVSQGSGWLPVVVGPILSILDVAPLKLVGRYMDDVSTAAREHQRHYLEASSSIHFEKEPLFPLAVCPPFAQIKGEITKGSAATPENSVVPSSSLNHKPPKKTLAATLVENTKKQSVALVPKPIAKLAQQFFSLFNPALFPHKPPPAPVAHRILFTDVEDELLAMGLMEYNTDWKAIQQRFLPCKSKHQIFVRQKNRCSSKAPDNPIKAVRRMKTSPLTTEEKARISEGLRVFKLDWMSIWKFIVPYRDPSLLQRQWRIAHGTQKSYRMDSAKREKRRLYELRRRQRKTAAIRSPHTSDNEIENAGRPNGSGEDCMDNDNEAYVHEAFLADWQPPSTSTISSEISPLHLKSRCQPNLSAEVCKRVREEPGNHGNQEFQSERCRSHEFPAPVEDTREPDSNPAHYLSFESHNMAPNCPVPDLTLNSSKYKPIFRPYRSRRPRSSRLIRLAPDLPPVNLPPSVRVISQAAFRSSQHGASTVVGVAGSIGAGAENSGCTPSCVVGSAYLVNATQNRSKILNPNIPKFSSQESGFFKNRYANEEKGHGSDLLMHPLLYEVPEDGHLPYYPLNCSTRTPSSFSFFPVNAHPFQNPCPKDLSVSGLHKSLWSRKTVSTSCGLNFHPLLQRSDVVSNISDAHPTSHLSVDFDLSRDALSQPHTPFNACGSASNLAACAKSTTFSGDANGLDLEINLNSAPRKDKYLGRDLIEGNLVALSISTVHSVEDATDTHKIHASKDGGDCSKDGNGNQSLPEIVMEQEELSDSDEEVEHVEFECEEMTDSEGEAEGLHNEEIVNTHKKDDADVNPS
ncbi:hypothetical protein Nepgr_007146 [Nepenthes gracilis]|uniref:Homeodomain-like superfamily protein n=1 Tax=Nepenthes gracilis TaxID=150966 RepID=A0AAD3S6L4_NEPGR|nr:hypothetical protein Nepgr_007146 [Nepenthes gracilis]